MTYYLNHPNLKWVVKDFASLSTGIKVGGYTVVRVGITNGDNYFQQIGFLDTATVYYWSGTALIQLTKGSFEVLACSP